MPKDDAARVFPVAPGRCTRPGMHPLGLLLHETSPYEAWDSDQYPADLQGWGSDHPVLRNAIEAIRPKIIVEVGTWKGASAIHMAALTKALGLDTVIICVDTWLGSPEHYLGRGEGWRESLLLRHGYPHLYFTFLSNVIRHDHVDCIVPLPSTSENAAYILKEKGIKPDLVYIDAAHEEEPAYRDIKAYWELLSPDGVLIGDDYLSWEGVTRAAQRFAVEVQRPIVGTWGKFAISRGEVGEPSITFATRSGQAS
ncbi:class I SAM-dependent methyltransferase [Caulobacter sp. S45]|uniref:class I SAM-dependent methyltransferase n=1 Tax=Caulobacter sp. S45 TaxID=1641861 RepID=UPI001575CE72|nr:class I SAM-dependent methyltransferase [Caulobacter sp. S45]